MNAYRFDHPAFTDIMRDMYIGSGELGPGDPAPDFDLPTIDGAESLLRTGARKQSRWC